MYTGMYTIYMYCLAETSNAFHENMEEFVKKMMGVRIQLK